MSGLQLHLRISRRLRQLLPPGLVGVKWAEPGEGWSASPLARLPLGTGARWGRLQLTLDDRVAAAIHQDGMAGLPACDGALGWSGWHPLGRRPRCFKAVLPQARTVLLLDAVRQRLWLLWGEPASTRARTRY